MDIRLPNINANTDRGQLEQIRSYLYQFAEQMQWALNNLQNGQTSNAVQTVNIAGANIPVPVKEDTENKINNFAQIKALIIKSADIVDAFYQQMSARLDSSYVAVSDFGTYKEQNTQVIEATAQAITQNYTSAIELSAEDLQTQIDQTNAYIRTGKLDEDAQGNPIYGLEIGQQSSVDGETTFNKYARFTSNRLSFFDNGGIEVAYISDYKLYITNVQLIDTLILGGYKLQFSSNGLYFKWIGR